MGVNGKRLKWKKLSSKGMEINAGRFNENKRHR
jgi:hypothetical protein